MRTEKNEQEHDLIAIIALVMIVTIFLIAGLLTFGVNPEMVKNYFDDSATTTPANREKTNAVSKVNSPRISLVIARTSGDDQLVAARSKIGKVASVVSATSAVMSMSS